MFEFDEINLNDYYNDSLKNQLLLDFSWSYYWILFSTGELRYYVGLNLLYVIIYDIFSWTLLFFYHQLMQIILFFLFNIILKYEKNYLIKIDFTPI